MAVTKQQLAQWSREFAAKNPDKVSGAGSTAQNITTKKNSVTKEQLSQWSREFDKKEAQRQAEQEQNTRDKALQQYTERHISDMGEVDARNEPSQALRAATRAQSATGVSGKFPLDAGSSVGRKMAGAATGNSGSGPARQMPEAAARALDMGQKWGVPAKSGNVLENVGSGAMAYGSGPAQELRASFAKDSVPDEFDRINQWMDTGDNKNLADAVRRVDNTHGAYTDADLIRKGGWTQAQIDEARKMNAALDAIPAWQRGVRRAANAIGGIGDTVAAAPVLGAEYGVQAGKNIDATLKNWKQVEQEVKGDEHAQSLFNLLTDVDMDYNPTWPESRNRELISMGYNSKEIREMRQRLAGLEVSDGIDKNQSVGYQLYDRGQQLTAAAQSGLSPTQRAVAGAVTSAAENLAVAGVNPAAVLPILSAQGAAEAMGQSAEKGESAGKALGGGLAKFGAGWAINSVGAADLAKTMGSDYAKDTLAGQIADWVQGLAGSSELAQRYPAVAAAISGGIDNSMQAFAETYADMAIDAALGDSEAAKNLFTKDTFLTALESGLSGGASGALGGAVGSGLAKLNGGDASLLGQTEHYDQMDRMKRAAAQQKEWEARAAEPSQPAAPAATENISGQEENLSPFPSADAARERSSPDRGAFLKGNSTESVQRAAEPSQSAAPTAPPEGRATGVPGSSELDAGSAAGREMVGLATEGSGSVNEAAAQSENPAVRQFAEVAASDSLTGKTIGLFTPNAENRENRAAFEQAYGVTLPDTAGATRRMLRDIAAQQNVKSEAAPAVQSAELPSEAASVPQTVQDAPAETADAVPETAAPDNVREAAAAAAETDSYENAPLRETLGLRPEAPKTQREAEVQRALEGWRVTDKAAETISKNMPDRVDADRYAAAASPLYRLGRRGADTFAQALELAGSMSGTAADINYILSTDAGRTALEIAYTQGKGERMLYAEKMTELGGALGSESTSGKGEVYAKGTMRQESDPASQIISLNAAATGTDAVLRDVLQNDRSIRAYVDTETARIFFGDSAQDIFGTVLHEDYHWYNALDAEGARTLQEHALEYLAKSSGYESLDEMVRAKLEDYSAQSLTYEQAAEELVADAWRGIFDSEESFKRWVTFQRGQAEKNAGKSGAIHKVMEQVRQMLDGLISRAKEVLTIDPDNRAALKAKRLAEAEKRTLQDEYFAHAEKAMDNLRAAKENAAALRTESAAEKQGVRLSILKDKAGETYIKIDEDILKDVPQEEWKSTVKQAIKERFPNGFERNGWTILNSKDGRNEFVWSKYTKALQWENVEAYADKMRMASNLDEIIKTADEVYREPAHHKNAEAFNRGKIKVMIGPNAYEADVLTAIRADEREIFYDIVNVQPTKIEPFGGTHVESEDSRSRLPKGSIYQESADTVLKTEEGGERPSFPANKIITQNDAPVKKNIRFQMASPVEVNSEKELVAVHNLTEENLREALDLGGMPSPSIAVVKAQDGHSKYGPISLVFGPDAIDPQANRANRVYGSDAWTPTRPNVEYEVNSKAAADFEDTVYEASQSDFEGKFANSSSLQRIGVDEVSSENREELAQKLQRDTAVQLAYLKAQGEKVEPIYRTEKEQFDSLGNDSLEKIIEYAGADELKKVFEGGDFDLMDKLADKAADALEEKYTHGSLEGQNRRWQMRINKLRNENRGRLYGLLEHAYKMMTDTSNGKVELDVEATREAIRQAAPEAAVKNWVKEQLGSVLEQKGIRNSKDRFTPGGKRRSFTELHNPYTLENLVAAMNDQNARGQDVWGLSASTLMSTTTAEYKNLDEVRADKGRLQQMPEEEYKALLKKADHQIEVVIDKLRSETEAHTDNSFEEREILGDILLRAAQGSQTAAAIGKAFAKEGYIIGKDTAQMIRQLYKDVAAIPTGYFEAKPQRAVGFDEVKAAVLPDNASETLVNSLKEQGVPVYQYKAGDDAKRNEILNKLPNVRFQKAEQADRDAKQNQQRQASRVLAEKAAAFDTLNQFFGLTKNTRLSDAALESLAIRWTKTNGSRADRTKLANETRALVEYLRSEGADMAKAQGLAETLAGEVLDEATYRNTELWNEYPDLHDLTYTVDKNGKAKAELVKRYGSWTEAVAEARRHGVKLRQAEGYRDGNPAEQYEAIVNDTRAVGGVKESAAALFRSAAQEAGVAGAAGMESTEWLDVLMNVHDTIKPKMMSRFADAAEYEDAKVELAGRMIGDIMSHPEMTDAEAVFEGILKHNREVAAMAAGSEERAAEVTKGLKSVQQAQRKAFADRMRENSRSQSAEAKSVSRAERQLNENLETLGAQVSTAAGLDEKMTALREAYEREWKAEKSRMKQARQEMLDEIKLERQQMRSQINDLSRQVAGEQRRADRAEHQLLVQENEIMEWEAENQRKAEAWQEKQAQRNAIAIETARQQRDEDIAVAKALAEKRVQKARDARKAEELKRSIRNNAAQLNQMVLRPKPGKYVQKSLIVQAAEVAKLADMTVLNNNAVAKLTALQDSIRRSGEMDAGIHADWENSGVEKLIQMLRDDMNASKQAKLDRLNKQLEEAKALPDGDKAEQLRDRLRQRIRETENRTYLPMTVDQLRMLKAITASTLHMIRTENKTLSLARAEEVDGMAMKAAREVLNSEGNGFGEKFEKAKGAMNRYQLDMLGGTRMFRRLGGYTQNGQMEKLGQMLNDGQRRQTEILVEGESLFANVTGKEHLKEVEAFAGPGAELVDIGLKDSRGNAAPLNHAQLCSLYMLLRNEDSRHHLMTGGLTLPDAAQYAKGNIERAYQRSQAVMLGTLVGADGVPMADTILQTVQDAMTDYDRAWCEDMKDFFGRYTTNLINETSMKLLGYDRATVKNYYPIAVDRSTLATEIEGVKMDATIEGRGFLKERVKSDKPILLEECQNVVKRSLRDTAAYAGLAAPIRDVQRVLNSTVETAEGIGVLKDKIIGEKWGRETVSYINDLLTDLQTRQRHRSSTMSRALDRMRGNYAGAILTVNPGVAIAQAASLPTAGAVLGADTMAAVLPFVKNFSGKQRAAVEAEIRQHGDALLQYRLRGTKRGEMSSIGAHKNLVAKASEAMPAVTGWITGMDEITVAALWEGAKRYVERHAAEFGEDAAEKGSEAYWEAVNKMYQRVIEETQPNYTTMQRAGIQRSDNEFVKTLTMFTTQRFQNYGILADAVGDYKAQKARYAADQSAENKAEVQRAGQDLRRAAASQAVQTAVFALMKIGADFLLHRWDKEQDENGDITAASVGKRFFDLYTESAAGNFLYGAEIYSVISNAASGTDYDVVSATNISAVNDLFAAFTKTAKLLRTDTGEMSEEELAAHHQKLNKAVLKDIQCGLELYGVPAANIRKVMQAFEGYWEDAQAIGSGEGFSFSSAPSSATGQYDRLYNAIQSGDSEEAAAAMKKLEQMNKTDKVDSELARRLKQYDADVLAAAEARNAGKARAEEKARKAVFEKLREGLGVAPATDRAKGKADAARRAQLIDLVNKAVDGKADELLAGSKDGSIYDALLDEVKNGRAKDVQAEINRLMTAGKDKGSIKSKITEAVKEEYLAGSDGDRERLEKKLLALEDADENPLYEEKNFAQWVSAADKKAEKAKDEKNWWEGVK